MKKNLTQRDSIAQALARIDGAFNQLSKAVEELQVLPLPVYPALDKTKEAASVADIARAHVRELLKRIP